MDKNISKYGTIVNLMTSMTTLTTQINEEELGISKKDVPKEIVRALSSMQLVDPKKIKPLDSCVKRAKRCLERVGTRFLGSSVYFVPDKKLDDVMSELNAIRDDFNVFRDDLISHYDESCKEWSEHCESKYPGWGKTILEFKKPARQVGKACTFEIVAFSVGQPKQASLCGTYNVAISGLHMQLLSEISSVMKPLYEQSYKGKSQASHRTLTTLSNAREKLNGLSFISGEIESVVELIDSTLRSIPQKKNIVGSDFLSVSHLIRLLSNPESVIEHVSSHRDLPNREVQLPLVNQQLDREPEPVLFGDDDEVVVPHQEQNEINLTNWL